MNDYIKTNESDKKRDRERIEQINDGLVEKAGNSEVREIEEKFISRFENGEIDNFASKTDLKRAYQSLFT